ncbi:MAG: LamG domain-containing protein [Verrucomicrobiales bacterium]
MKQPTFACLLCGLIHSTALGAELVHLWDFEGENWGEDKVGLAHGEISAETKLVQVPGPNGVGTGMSVPSLVGGGDERLVIDSAQLVAPGAEAFSVSYWVRMPDDDTTSPRGIFDFSGNGGDGVQSLYIGSSRELAFRIDVPGAFSLVKVPMPLEDDQWHSVVATYDPAAGLEVHIDGLGIDGSADPAGGSVAYDTESYIGSFNFSDTEEEKGLGGAIDDLAIYSGVLSEEEIIAISQLPQGPPPQITSIRYDPASGVVEISWVALEGEAFALWSSPDLRGGSWSELDDSLTTGPDGGTFSFALADPQPGRLFFQLRGT